MVMLITNHIYEFKHHLITIGSQFSSVLIAVLKIPL